MLNIKELTKALKQVAEEKGLEPEKVLDVIESSIAAAYKKEYGQRGEVVKCKLDQASGELKFWQVKTVVDESTVRFVTDEEETEERAKEEEKKEKKGRRHEAAMEAEDEEQKLPRFNPERHITLEEASRRKRQSRLFCRSFANRNAIRF
jgi:transcription termination/antitermination protein NusA